MPGFRIKIRKESPKKDGTIPVYLIISHNYKEKWINLNLYLTDGQLNKKRDKFVDKSVRYQIDDLLLRLRNNIALNFELDTYDISEVVDIAFNKNKKTNEEIDFVEFVEKQIFMMKQRGQASTAAGYQTMLNSLKQYCGKDSINILSITNKFIRQWQEFLLQGKLASRGVQIKINSLKTMHNLARKFYNDEDTGEIPIPITIIIKPPKPKHPKQRTLSIEQIQQIINFQPTTTHQQLAKDIFLLSFGLCGINNVDLYNAHKINDNVLIYTRQKTANTKYMSSEMQIQIPACINFIAYRYFDTDKDFVFNFHKLYRDRHNFTRALNTGLDIIGQEIGVSELTMYYARHSWASIAYNNAGIDKYTIHDALNHSDREMKITDIYINKEYTRIWQANEKVLSLFQWSAIT